MGHASAYQCNALKGAAGGAWFKIRYKIEVEQSLDLRGLVKNMLKAWREVGGGASWRPRQQDVPRMCTLDEQRHYDERRNDEKKISATAI